VLDNVYQAVVGPEPQPVAKRLVEQVFEVCDDSWRGLGTIANSGLRLKDRYAKFDTLARFDLRMGEPAEPTGCRCGDVIQGLIDPPDCPMFAKACTPIKPIGPCMVSSEGSCQAWYKYRQT